MPLYRAAAYRLPTRWILRIFNDLREARWCVGLCFRLFWEPGQTPKTGVQVFCERAWPFSRWLHRQPLETVEVELGARRFHASPRKADIPEQKQQTRRGGEAAPLRKCCEATKRAQTGWSDRQAR